MFSERRETTPEFLNANFETAYDGLKHLSSSLPWPEGAAEGKWTSTALNREECCQKVALFTDDRLWPLINVVRYGMKSDLLAGGNPTDLSSGFI